MQRANSMSLSSWSGVVFDKLTFVHLLQYRITLYGTKIHYRLHYSPPVVAVVS